MLNKIKRQLHSFKIYILKYIYQGVRYCVTNLDFSSSHLVLLSVSRCFNSVVSCQSHTERKSLSELRAESGIFISPNKGLLQRLWILLPFCSHVPPDALDKTEFLCFLLLIHNSSFVCVCVRPDVLNYIWYEFRGWQSFSVNTIQFYQKSSCCFSHFASFCPIAMHSVLLLNKNCYFG